MSKETQKTDELINQLCEGLEENCDNSCVIRRFIPWAILAFLYVVGVVWFTGLRYDIQDAMNNPIFIFEIGMALIIFFTCALSAAYLTLPDHGQKIWIKIVPLTLVSVFVFWSVIKGYTEGISFPSLSGLHCVERGAIVEIVPILIMLLVSTRGHTTQPSWLVAMNVIAVVALGWVGLRLTCSMGEMGHSYIFHLLPFAIIGAALSLFARKLFKW